MFIISVQRGASSSLHALQRLFGRGSLPMNNALARYVLKLGFSEDDQQRMEQLAEQRQLKKLTSDEEHELASYIQTGHFLALLQSKARLQLKKKRV